jgi:hypothetical protein
MNPRLAAAGRRVLATTIPTKVAMLCTMLMPLIPACDKAISPLRASFEVDGRAFAPNVNAAMLLPTYLTLGLAALAAIAALVAGPRLWVALWHTVALVPLWVSDIAVSLYFFWMEGPDVMIGFAMFPASVVAAIALLATIRGGDAASGLRAIAWWALLCASPITFESGVAVFLAWPEPPPSGALLWLVALLGWPPLAAIAATSGLIGVGVTSATSAPADEAGDAPHG